MAKIEIDNLLLILQQMKFDGHNTVNICELESDDDVPASLHLNCDDGMFSEDYDDLYDINDSDNIEFDPSEYSTYVPNELEIICCALDISHQYLKQLLNSTSLSADERSETSKMLKEHESLFNIFLKIVN